jgi:hypothetical protein
VVADQARMDALFEHRTPRPAYRQPRGEKVGRVLSAGADPRRGCAAFQAGVAWSLLADHRD